MFLNVAGSVAICPEFMCQNLRSDAVKYAVENFNCMYLYLRRSMVFYI
jgi:hypothetical protein